MRAYRILQRILRIAVQVFFRRIEVVGRDNIPPPGSAVIFCGNHPNSLLDPVLIIATCDRVVHFAAKDVLFENRLLRPILVALGVVPVRRRQESGGGPVDNSAMFARMHEVLGRGRAAGIFPEGISHDESQLAPLKTGAARIALGTKANFPDIDVYLVPTGLCYLTRNRFRSSVLIQFGPPIQVEADRPARREATTEGEAGEADDPTQAEAAALTAELEAQLRALTINASDWDTARVLDGVRRLYQPADISLESRVELARRFNRLYPDVAHEPEVHALYARVRDYLVRLSAAGVADESVRRGLSTAQTSLRVARHVTLLVIWLPLAALGAPIHAPLALLLSIVGSRLSPRRDVIATTKFACGLLLTLAAYVSLPIFMGLKFGPIWAAATAIALPISGFAFVHVMARADALRKLFVTTARMLWLRRELAALRDERASLEAAIIQAVDRYRPPDLALLFPRDATAAAPTEEP